MAFPVDRLHLGSEFLRAWGLVRVFVVKALLVLHVDSNGEHLLCFQDPDLRIAVRLKVHRAYTSTTEPPKAVEGGTKCCA